ncbi:ABC transporter substrate-binding protein [Larkinella soli]|uniref:ABC transporter substrate-binding protein n=1 Tax=Larkinella soli TaxID=1770527 RepID=UPI0013E3398B|nr:extracellular solute-binding protein [Larkinella soli]
MKTLRGITWNHTRGYAPLAVTSKVWNDFHPEVSIHWDIRSLQSFGEEGLDTLVRQYDLLLIDHPFIGTVARSRLFVPLDDHLPASDLALLRSRTVGASFGSYEYGGHLWALPVDAAAQGSVARRDWFERENRPLPANWNEVLELARETGKVAMPMAPMGLLGAFFSLYANQFAPPFQDEEWAMDDEKAVFVINQLSALYDLIGSDALNQYPVALLNRMGQTDELVYMPITFGYANYGMAGYVRHPLTFGPLPGARPDGATLGGVGLAVSASCEHLDVAVAYSRWVAGPECQSTLYPLSGGQPAGRVAWDSPLLNELTHQFYRNTRETVERAFVRPRFDGFHDFQSKAARLLQRSLIGDLQPGTVIRQWQSFYSAAYYAFNS